MVTFRNKLGMCHICPISLSSNYVFPPLVSLLSSCKTHHHPPAYSFLTDPHWIQIIFSSVKPHWQQSHQCAELPDGALTSLILTCRAAFLCTVSIRAWVWWLVMLYRQSSFLSSHLALQLRNRFSKLSLSGFWQLRVEALREALHPVLLVLVLQSETENSQIRMSKNTILTTHSLSEFTGCNWS